MSEQESLVAAGSERLVLAVGELRPASGEQDEAGRREFAARFVRAGQIRAAGGRLGRVIVERSALQGNVDLFNNRAVFLDHADWLSAPSVRNLVGVTHGAGWNELDGSIDGLITFYETAAGRDAVNLLERVVADDRAGLPAPDVGLSLSFYPVWQSSGDGELRRVVDIEHVESIDLVFEPAADGRILAALSAGNQEGVKTMDTVHEEGQALDKLGPRDGLRDGPGDGRRADTVPAADAGEWQLAMAASASAMIIGNSGLPEVSRARLSAQRFASPAELAAAVESEREYLAALSADQVIQIGGTPPRGGNISVADGRLELQGIADWMFGVESAPLPEPMMRSPRTFYHALTGDHEWHGQVVPERVLFASASTTNLAGLAANAMNKVLVETWAALEAFRWFERLVSVQPNDGSVLPMAWVQFGGIGNLPVVAQGGTYTELQVADSKESDDFGKHGGYVGITEEMFRNNQVGLMQAIPRSLAVASVRTRSASIAGIFTANSGTGPTLDNDSTVLFHSTHGSNVQTTALSVAGWKAARLECFKHLELGSGKAMGLYPKYALVPADLADDALVYFGYGSGSGGYPGTGNNDTNPYGLERSAADPRPVPVVVPDWTDVKDWAYLVDPKLHPVLMMSYAQSPGGRVHPMPEIWAVTSPNAGMVFTNDTLPVKVRDWYSFGVATWRGVGKRNVA